MKRLVITGLFLISFLANTWSQVAEFKNYYRLPIYQISDVVNLPEKKFVMPCEIKAIQLNDGKMMYLTQNGNTVLEFQMTPKQGEQLNSIRLDEDNTLVLFTRTGTSKDNYRFVVDKIIPLKEVFGVPEKKLPAGLSTEDYYSVVGSYLDTGITDAEHLIADKINRSTQDALIAQALAQEEESKKVAIAEKQEAESKTRINERAAAKERERQLREATVKGGYKPCFGTSNKYSRELKKIAVFGSINTVYNKSFSIPRLNNPTLSEAINLNPDEQTKTMFEDIGYSKNDTSNSYICILFLTKIDDHYYHLDDYVYFGDVINKDLSRTFMGDYKVEIVDKWIEENLDK